MKRKVLFLALFILLTSCSSDSYKLLHTTGYTFGIQGDKYVPCFLDENNNIVRDENILTAFQSNISIYTYLKEKNLKNIQNKLDRVKEKAIYLSVCFDSNRLFVDKDNNLVKNLAYLNTFQQGNTFIPLEEETYDLLKLAYEITTYSKGYFNLCIGNLSSLWDEYIKKGEGIPSEDEINELLLEIPTYEEMDNVFTFNDQDKSVCINYKTKLNITFNGLAKGRFLDAIKEDLDGESSLVDAGSSSMEAYGDSIYDSWNINLRNPNYTSDEEDKDGYLKIHKQGKFSLSVSGDYQNYYFYNNKRYHHIINPFTGYPSTLHRSCAVIGTNSTYADALSTVLMMLSIEDSKKLLTNIEQTKNYRFKFITIDEIENKIVYNVEKDASYIDKDNVIISYF